MRLYEMISVEVDKVRCLKAGSDHYVHLVEHGVDKGQLDRFIGRECALKAPSCPPVDQARFTKDLEGLFDLGGAVAGGGAMARIFGTHKARDYDVFFDNPVAYAQAILAVQENPLLDVCFFIGKPYDSFDLAASKCSFTRETFDVHASCLDAIETGVSDVFPESIINADATLRRMLKYNRYAGIRFKMDQVLVLCSVFKVSRELAQKALKLCL